MAFDPNTARLYTEAPAAPTTGFDPSTARAAPAMPAAPAQPGILNRAASAVAAKAATVGGALSKAADIVTAPSSTSPTPPPMPAAPEAFKPATATAAPEAPAPGTGGIGSEFVQGLEAGAGGQNISMLGGAMEAGGVLAEKRAPIIARALRAGGQKLQDYGTEVTPTPQVGSIADVPGDSVLETINRFGKFAAFTAGSGIGTSLPSLAIGGAAGLTTANPMVGFIAGAIGPSYVQNLGDVYTSATTDPEIMAALQSGQVTEEQVAKTAALAAVPIAALDAVGLEKTLGAAFKPAKDALRARIMRGIATGAISEGSTEGLQNVVSQWAQSTLGQHKELGDRMIEVVDNVLGGVFAGGLMGGVAGIGDMPVAPRGATNKPGKEGEVIPPAPPGTPRLADMGRVIDATARGEIIPVQGIVNRSQQKAEPGPALLTGENGPTTNIDVVDRPNITSEAARRPRETLATEAGHTLTEQLDEARRNAPPANNIDVQEVTDLTGVPGIEHIEAAYPPDGIEVDESPMPKPPAFEPVGAGQGALPANAPKPADWRAKWDTKEVGPGRWRVVGMANGNPISPAFSSKSDAEVWADNQGAPTIDAAAHEAATSPQNDLPEPTEAQKKAGNYKKGHVSFQGNDIAIENPVGSKRTGTDPSGKPWSVDMSAHYGYVKRSTGADGDQVDVYLPDQPDESAPVHVFDQHNPETGEFDEHKAVLGVATREEAERIYDAHFSDNTGPKRRHAVTTMSADEFKQWVREGDTKKPAREAESTVMGMTDEQRRAAIDAEVMEERPNAPEVAQPTKMGRVKVFARTLNGIKEVNASLYEFPGHKGPQLAVAEYKSPRGQGYRVYLPKTGMMLYDNNGVGSVDETLNLAVQRLQFARKTLAARTTPGDKEPIVPAAAKPKAAKKAGTIVEQARAKIGEEKFAELVEERLADKGRMSPDWLKAELEDVARRVMDGEPNQSEGDDKTAEQPTKPVNSAGKPEKNGNSAEKNGNSGAPLTVETYTDKSIIVRGDTRTHKDRIKAIGGALWNKKAGGWIFKASKRADVEKGLADLLAQNAGAGEVLDKTEVENPAPVASRARLREIAKNIGVAVDEVGTGFHTRNGAVSIPTEDTSPEMMAAVSADHVFAHELGHAIMQKRGYSYAGFPVAELRKQIANWDELVEASKAFRPGVWNHANSKVKLHARKPNEVIADAIATVLLADNGDLTLLRDLPLNSYDLGFKVSEKPAAKPEPRVIGKNHRGQDIEEDADGVRSYIDSGVRVQESVSLRPTRDGMRASVDPDKRGRDFKTTDELPAAPKNPVAERWDQFAQALTNIEKNAHGNTSNENVSAAGTALKHFGAAMSAWAHNDMKTAGTELRAAGNDLFRGWKVPAESLFDFADEIDPRVEEKPATDDDLSAMFDDVLAEELSARGQPAKKPTPTRAAPTVWNKGDGEYVVQVPHRPDDPMGGFQNLGSFTLSKAGAPIGVKYFFEAQESRGLVDEAVSQWRKDNVKRAPKTPQVEPLGGMAPLGARPPAAPQDRTAGESLTSAAKNTAQGLSSAIKGLGELFGGKGGRLNSGLSFDEETYAKAKPLFIQAVRNLKDAASDLREAMRTIIRMVLDQFGAETADGMKPYVVRFVGDVQAGAINLTEGSDDGIQDGLPGSDEDEQSEGVQPPVEDGGAGSTPAGEDDGSVPDAGPASGGRAARGKRGTKGRSGGARGRKAGAGNADRTPAGNYRIEPGALEESRGPAQKARDNVRAIELARQIDAEGRPATLDEQRELALYVGWGGLSGAFPDGNGEYGKGLEAIGPKVRELLNDTEYATAQRSIQYAHYTSEPVIRAMWEAASQLGFKGGKVFEPGMGIGHFAGLMPGILAERTAYNGLELDHITARIARLLYPDWGVRQDDFTKAPLPENMYDLVIGNPPFADIAIKSDPKYATHGFLLHDYFFAKSLDAVRPGGLLMFISSAGTMNKNDTAARQYLADRADLVGAIRLPSTAFKANAGTEVTTDIIVMRKRLPGEEPAGQPFVDVTTVTLPDKFGNMKEGNVSSYFAAHPEMVLGEQGFFDRLYAGRYGVRPLPGADLNSQLSDAIGRLPANVMTDWADTHGHDDIDFASEERKEGSFYIDKDGRLMQHSEGIGRPVLKRGKGVEGGKSADELERIKGLIPVRDALRAVYTADLAGNTENADRARERLNKAYDDYVKAFGPINKSDLSYRRPNRIQAESARSEAREEARYSGIVFDEGSFNPSSMIRSGATLAQIAKARADAREDAIAAGEAWSEGTFDPVDMPDIVIDKRPNIDPFSDDPESYRLRAIERYNEATGEATKGLVFAESVISKEKKPEIASAGDAMLYVLNKHGYPDIDEIAHVANLTRDDVLSELGEFLFELPGAIGTYEMADDYLSGNVRKKLAEAEAAAQDDDRYRKNVLALLAAQPDDLPPSLITATLGMPWIPAEDIMAFGTEALGLADLEVSYLPKIAEWSVSGDKESAAATSTWGTVRVPAPVVLAHALNRIPIKVYDSGRNADGSTWRELNTTETEGALLKLQEIKDKFASWVFGEEARAELLATLYNHKYNNLRPWQGDGSYLTTPGVSSEWTWRPHQLRVIARILRMGNTYMGHAVGAGKTSAMIGAGMEMRRLGLARKPMYVVPNHMLGQFTKEFYEQYPTAKIMVADERRFHTNRRKQFIADVASQDLDAVIITHSAFGKIPVSSDFQDAIIQEQIDNYREILDELGDKKGSDDSETRITRKRVENAIEKLDQRLSGRMKGGAKDQVFTFEEMGVDFLFVDEAHLFRKLDFATRMSGVKGISPEGSQMSMDLYVKSRYLRTQNPSHHMVLASGTPITNTMAELYSVSRYVQERELEERGLAAFDAWAAAFGDTVTEVEQDAAGGYKAQTRFAQFVNIPELSAMVRQVMDVVTSNDLAKYVTRPTIKGGKRQLMLAEKSDGLDQYQKALAARMTMIENRKGPPKPGDDILLSVINDGRLAAIDMRLIDPTLGKSDPPSKLDMLVNDVYRTWEETKAQPLHKPGPDGYSEKPTDYGPATQMVFANLGIGPKRPFNVAKYIVSELVSRGVPRTEIALIADHDTHVARQKLFNDMNEGKVRVLIGSTAKMATGVNAQRRLFRINNLDPLWYPADDEQRIGRGLRQGNMNPEIEVVDYSTKGTYDSQMWNLMAKKGRFIEGFFRGDPTLRTMEDLGESSQYEQAKAMTTADPRLIELTNLKQDLQRAERRKDSFDSETYNAKRRVQRGQSIIASAHKNIARIEGYIEKRIDTTSDNFFGQMGDTLYKDRAEFGKAMWELRKEIADTKEVIKNKMVGEFGGFPLMADRVIALQALKDNSGEFLRNSTNDVIYAEVPSTDLYLKLDNDNEIHARGNGALALVNSLEQELADLEARIARNRRDIADAEKDIREFTPRMTKTFDGQAAIDEVRAKLNDLEITLAKESAAARAAAQAQAAAVEAQAAGIPLTDTKAFKAWFSDSKVVDADGKPLVVYHATPASFDAFKPGGNDPSVSGAAIWATPNKEEQPAAHNIRKVPDTPNRVYGNQSGKFSPGTNVMPLYMRIQNPLVATSENWKEVFADTEGGSPWVLYPEAITRIKASGHDGVMYYEDGALREVAAFDPEQVKSATGNNGEFSPDNPDIRYAARQSTEAPERGLSASGLHDYLVRIYGGQAIRNLLRAGKLKIVAAGDPSLPQDAKEAMRDGRNIYGLYDEASDTTFLVHDNLTDAGQRTGDLEDGAAIFLHELGVHYGMPDFLGLDHFKTITKQLRLAAKANSSELGIAARAAYAQVPASTRTDHIDEEALAWLVTDRANHKLGLVQRILMKIRAWLVKHGFKNVTSPDELVELARGAVNHAAGERLRTNGGARFAARDVTNSEAFKNWFGDSKAVDEAGRPLRLYHGTTASFDEFNPNMNPFERGVFLTPDPAMAGFFTAGGSGRVTNGGNILPLYARLTNPMVVDFQGQNFPYRTGVGDILESARAAGHDGVILKNVVEGESFDIADGVSMSGEGIDQYVVFNPEQVKSATGNSGAFDPSNSDIRYAARDATNTPTFKRWFGDSKVVDESGKPLKIYRGINLVSDGALNGEARDGYAAFGSPSPHVANTYANPAHTFGGNGAVTPLYIKADKLIEFPVRTDRYGYRRFDMFAFDDKARALRPGEVLVARKIVDIGPRARTDIDPAKLYSYENDVYAWNRGTQVKSATGNNGDFDPSNPSILYARREPENPSRRGFVMGAAATLAAGGTYASYDNSTLLGKARALSDGALSQRMSKAEEKMLRGDGGTQLDGPKRVSQVLDSIAKTGPVELRALAAKVRDLMPAEGFWLTVDDDSRANAHGALEFEPIPMLTLFTAEDRHGLNYGTFIHEALHAAVAARYHALSIGMVRSNDAVLGKEAPKAAPEMEQFEKIWREFRSATVLNKPGDRDQLSVEEAARSPDEFFVRALTDASLQRYLAGIEYRGKTLWERFKDWVTISLLGLRRSGTRPSWLDAALAASGDLLTAMEKDPSDFARSGAVVTESYSQRDAMYSRREPVEDQPALERSLFQRARQRFEPWLDAFRYEAQDKFHYLNKAQKEAAAERGLPELPENEDAYLAELRYHGMAGAAIEDFQRDHVDPMLKAIKDAGLDIDRVDEFLHARHAKEANAQLQKINPTEDELAERIAEAAESGDMVLAARLANHKPYTGDNTALSGMSDEEADRILADAKAKDLDKHNLYGFRQIGDGPPLRFTMTTVYDALEDIGRRVDEITAARRELLVSSGLEKRGTIAAWESAYQHYVPLKREGKGDALPRRGKGYDTRGKEKRRAGSTRAVEHILANVVAQHEATLMRAEKAKVGRAMMTFALKNPNPELYEVNKVDYQPTFDAQGLVTYRADPGMVTADNVFVVRVRGQDHRITFNDANPDAMKIAAAIKNLGAEESGPIINVLSKFTRILALVNTGANPEFIISNFARDIQTAGYNLSGTEADALKWQIIGDVGKAWSGIRKFQKQQGGVWAEHFDAFRKAGGQTGWMDHYKDIGDREKALINKVRDMEGGAWPTVKRGLKAIDKFIEDENTAVENAIRLSAFVHAREAGLTEAQAARLAKELTVNFNRRGAMGKTLNALYLFYNASIQGQVRIVQAIAKSRKVQGLVVATVIGATLLDMWNRSVGDDDDDDKPNPYDSEAMRYVKDRNLVVMLPGGDYIKIPLPWGYNVFHVMGQTIGEMLTKPGASATSAAARVAGAVVDAFNPIGGSASPLQMISPTVVDPVAQWYENKDFAGRPLRPSGNPFGPAKPQSQQYWSSVRPYSKWITDQLNELTGGDEVRPGAIDFSPEAIDLTIDTLTGGAGRFVADTVGAPWKRFVQGEQLETYEVPLLRKVYGTPGAAQTTQDYYKNRDAVALTQAQLSHYKTDGARLREIRTQHATDLRMIPILKSTEAQLKHLREVKKLAKDRAREREIEDRMHLVMDRFNERYFKVVTRAVD